MFELETSFSLNCHYHLNSGLNENGGKFAVDLTIVDGLLIVRITEPATVNLILFKLDSSPTDSS